MTEVYRYSKRTQAMNNREEIEKINEKIKELENNSGKIKDIVKSHSTLMKDLTKATLKIAKVLFVKEKK